MTIGSHSMDRRTALRGFVTIAGAAVLLPSMASLGGCSTKPATLDEHMALLKAVVGRIIPKTDTPGAIEAGVPEYIAAVFEQHMTPEQQSDFAAGLGAIATLAKREGGSDFLAATPETQDDILGKLAGSADGTAGKDTWQQLHDMAVFGFYTSEAATQELAYEEIPGRQIGCLPFEDIGRAWLDRGV
jgi:hypothetical protein